MNAIRKILAALSAAALALTFVGAGFLVCTLAPATSALANVCSDDVTSPFSRSQLVKVADATRDYSFGSHDLLALYNAIYQVDLELRQDIVMANGTLPFAFPALDNVSDTSSVNQLAAAFAGASEMYCFSSETVSHLDDCYRIAQVARVVLAIAALIVLAGAIACGVLGGKRSVGAILLAGGTVALIALVALAVFAALDFTRFFALFHQLFFSQGNWQFPYDSLLICALPTGFWIGMGVIWLVVTVGASILSIVIGRGLNKK